MVYCVIVGCSSKGVNDKTKSFFHLPAVIRGQGEAALQLSERRRMGWLTAIGIADFPM
jgi:hypothetical protein